MIQQLSSHSRFGHHYHRRLRVEHLEDRRMLAVVTVDTELDVIDFDDGVMSLREAVFFTNTLAGPDAIEFDSSLVGKTIFLDPREVRITDALAINGLGRSQLTIDAQQQSRIFNITATTGDFSLVGITLTGGQTAGDNVGSADSTFSGGAIRSETADALTLTDVTVSNSSTSGIAEGGGIFANGPVTITNSTVSGNSSNRSGGGVFAHGNVTLVSSTVSDNSSFGLGGGIRTFGSVTLTRSTVSGNSAEGIGGGISATGAVTVMASTVSGNSAAGVGGGISASGAVTITNSTVSGNSTTGGIGAFGGGVHAGGAVALSSSTITNNQAPSGEGGGIWNFNDPITISNSIVAGNTDAAGSPDLRPGTGALVVSYSLIGDNVGTGLAEAQTPDVDGNLIGGPVGGVIDPLLGPLVDNGGTTLTHALLEDSPAIDAGDPLAMAGAGDVPEFDQRGFPFRRVVDGNINTADRIDMGAFELFGATLIVSTLEDETDGDTSAGRVSLREAIEAANVIAGQNEVVFDPTLFASGPQTLLLTMGELEITDALVVNGPAPELLTIDAQQQSRIFNITAVTSGSPDFTFGGMTLTGGQTTGDNERNDNTFSGGAIRSLATGNLTIENSRLAGNSATGNRTSGGAVFAEGEVSITSSTISGNSGNDGGGIHAAGNVTVTSSTISGNSGSGVSGTNVTVIGSTISGNDGGGIRGDTVTVTDSMILGNTAGKYGGGIRGDTVMVISSTVSGNSVTYGVHGSSGGGIQGGNVTVISSTVSGNSASSSRYGGRGGGIEGANVTVIFSTISENSADNSGGGIAGGDVTVASSTISGNSAYGAGGGIRADGIVTVTSSTISGNSADNAGGGIRTDNRLTMDNSILAGNTALRGPDLEHEFGRLSVSYSLVGDQAGTSLTEAQTPDANGNLIGGPTGGVIDPVLGPLSNNGGPTLTHSLLAGSPAIDAGDLLAMPGVGDTPEFDQRGTPYTRLSGGRIDMGAHERQSLTVEIVQVASPTVTPVEEVTIQFSSAVSGFDVDDLELSRNGVEILLDGSQTLSTSDNQVFLLGGLTNVTTASGYYTLKLISSGSGIMDADGDPLDNLDSISWVMGRSVLGLTVDTLIDEADGNVDDGDISLRDAIAASVPGETINFDASLDGGTILLSCGELVITRPLTIDAALLPAGITIDASGNDPTPDEDNGDGSRIFNIDDGNNQVDSPVTIGGLTLTGGDARLEGGAIRVRETVTVTSSTISGNSAGDDGGGIYAFRNVTVTGSTISGNSAGDNGGGFYARGDVTVTSSTISGNSAGDNGGGSYARGGGINARGDVTVASSTISGNSAGYDGGGGIRADGSVTITGSTISGNSALYGSGGGIRANDIVTVTSSSISDNSADGFGGGIHADGAVIITSSTISGNSGDGGGGIDAYGTVTVTSSTISGNSGTSGGIWASNNVTVTFSTISGNSGNDGGGIQASGNVIITSSTISGNSALEEGGGIRTDWEDNNPVTIKNSIVAGNIDGGTAPDLQPGTGTLTIENSLIGDNTGTRLPEAPVGSPDADGNLVGGPLNGIIDPMLGPLTNNGGPTQTHALMSNSPAIDAGDPLAMAGMDDVPEFDQRGNPFSRVADGTGDGTARIDMGAFEVPDTFVVDTLADEDDGIFSEGDLSLREAIGLANAVAGPHNIFFDPELFPTADGLLLTMGEMEITDVLAVNGPGPDLLTIDAQQQSRIFNITAETGDFAIAGMTLTGGRTTGQNESNSFRGGAISSVTSGNLTIQNSYVHSNSANSVGGGVYGRDVTITNSTISENSTLGIGGGIFATGEVTITNSTISENRAGDHGGGIYALDNVTVNSSTISGNSAEGSTKIGRGGGGIHATDTVIVIASMITGNSAVPSGGGILGDTVIVNDSTISGNSAGLFGGGGISGRNVIVTSSTVSGNSARRRGGIGGQTLEIKNSIVAGNTDDGTAPDVQPNTGTLTVEHSLIGDNTGTGLTEAPVGSPDANGNLIGGPINGVIDPMLAPLANNGGPTQTHRLLPGSPAIDAGDPLAMAGAGDTPQFDQRGSPFTRVYDAGDGARIDMGSFELQPQPGDLNGDLAIDFADLTPFALALTDPAAYEAMYPDLDRVFLCDVSGDRLCNFGDLQPFADLLVGGEGSGDGASVSWDPPVSESSQRVAYRPVVPDTGARDLALLAWVSSFEDDADGGAESEPVRSEADEVEGLPTGVVESVFQGVGDRLTGSS